MAKDDDFTSGEVEDSIEHEGKLVMGICVRE